MPTRDWSTLLWYSCITIAICSLLCMLPGHAVSQTVLFEADFEDNSGDNNWTYQGGATDGNWLRGTPTQYFTQGFLMERPAFEGTMDLLTGENFSQDVDGGPTRARSRDILLPSGSVILDFEYYFSYNPSASTADHFRFEIRRSSNNQLLRRVVNERGSSSGKPAAWTHITEDLSAFAGIEVYIRVQARDIANGSKIEAAVDLIQITGSNDNKVEGFVFEDLDVDGVFDPSEEGFAGVTVSLFENGLQIDQTTSASNGFYEFQGLSQGQPYQVVFSGWPSGVSESVIGPDNRGSVQNIAVGDGFVNFGLYTTALQCAQNPFLLIPCYVEGQYNGAISSEAAIVKLRASAEGHDFLGTNYTSNYEAQMIADYGSVGTVYGIGWQLSSKRYYASSFHKRYSGFGPSGPDAIYQLDLNGNVTGVISLDNLLGTTNSTGGDVHNFNQIGGFVYDLGLNDASFDAVGKRSFGDIEMSGDDSTLYVVNLFDRKIYGLNVSSGNTASTSIRTVWDAPDETGAGRHRPFGLAWNNGKLWVGSVDENGTQGYVHSIDVTTGLATLELTIPLTFSRQAFYGNANNTTVAPSDWNAWQSNTNFTTLGSTEEKAFPQPIISDIEFANDGAMIIGFRDRFGDQSSAQKRFNQSATENSWGVAQGDILKACFTGTSFVLESGTNGPCPAGGVGLGNSGPNGQEFYFWDIYELEQNTWDPNSNTGAFHWEVTQGGLVQIPSFDYVITTALDPIDDFSGGIIKLNNTTGAREGVVAPTTTDNVTGGYTIYEGGNYEGALPPNNGFAAKANGLGDVESACFLPITIGNLVWYDVDEDGIMEQDEPGLANVTVEIYEGSTLIGTTTTDSLGNYFFGGFGNNGLNFGEALKENTSYEIRIPISSAQANDGSITNIGGLTSQNVNNNNSDLLDSDAQSPGGYAFISITTGLEGTTDYSFDFGFTTCGVVTTENEYEGCTGDGYSVSVGNSTYNEANPTGADTLQTTFGCDSIVNTSLVFLNSVTETLTHQGCQEDGFSIVVNGTTYDQTNPQGQETFTTQSGCDSIVIIDLAFEPTYNTQESYTGCAGDGYEIVIDGIAYNEGNPTGTDTLQSVNGCDSIVTINLTFNPVFATQETYTGCSGDGYEIIIDGNIYNEGNPTGTESLQTVNGCDSIVTIDLTFNPVYTTQEIYTGCSGDGYEIIVDGTAYNEGNPTGTENLQTVNGCDSIITVSLSFAPSYSDTFNYSGCAGDGYEVIIGSTTYNEGNPTGIETLQSVAGCDSVVTINLAFEPAPTGYLTDVLNCKGDTVFINGVPPGFSEPIINHQWTVLGNSTSANFVLSNTSESTIQVNTDNADLGLIYLEYTGMTAACAIKDTVLINVLSKPLAGIVAEVDTSCSGADLELSALINYAVTPDSGMINPSANVGLTLIHDIIGVQDPEAIKVVITLPTWDDHFDTVKLNGQMILPEIFEQASYNAGGMNCFRPWIANQFGLPRSIIEITGDTVRYFSSLTPTSITMTEVFPVNWNTTPQPFIEGDNTLEFGVQNTAGPVSGNWFVEAFGNNGYDYQWSTGDTTTSITVSPSVTTTYQLTVTAPSGCSSVAEKTIYAGSPESETYTYTGCSGDGYSIEVAGVTYNESNPNDTIILQNQAGCDSIVYVALTYNPSVVVDAGMPTGPICSNAIVILADLNPSITGGTTTGTWSSMGDGLFDNGGAFGGGNPATTYSPSPTEIDQGVIILTLTSHDPSGPCEPQADAVMILINDIRCAQFPWAGND